MKKYFYLGLLILLAACGKDDDKLIQTCENFPDSPSILGYKTTILPNLALFPSFNPNNAQELCFVKNSFTPDGDLNDELWKVNLATGQQQKLAEDSGDLLWGQPDWGKNNWILFERPGNQIYKIKSNGDSLTALPFKDICYNPKWNNAKGTFLHNLSGNQYGLSHAVERKASGEVEHFLKVPQGHDLYNLAISPNGDKLVSATEEKFYSFDYPSLKAEILRETDMAKGEFVGSKAWHPDNLHVFWTCRNGLYKTNVATKQTWQLKSGCDSRSYHSLSVSPDGKTLAVTRHDTKRLDEFNLETEISIYLMDENGKDERKLEL